VLIVETPVFTRRVLKLNVENRTSAAVVALETFRAVAEKSENRSSKPWPQLLA
jgi:hypothetical protein